MGSVMLPTTDSDPRATELHKLQPSDLEGLPTNNLECERDLSEFDKLARRSAASSNRKFTAKGMRNDMTLNNAGVVTVEKMTRDIAKVMDKSEQEWVKSQKLLTEEKLKRNVANAQKAEEYIRTLLQKCKVWGGPFTTVDELQKCVETQDETKLKSILRTELCFRRHTSRRDFTSRPYLYKVNQVSSTEMKLNLAMLLSSDGKKDSPADLPSEDDMLAVFDIKNERPVVQDEAEEDSTEVSINEMCVVIWDEKDWRKWYLGTC